LPGLDEQRDTSVSSKRGIDAGLKHLSRMRPFPDYGAEGLGKQCDTLYVAFDHVEEMKEYLQALDALGIPCDRLRMTGYQEAGFKTLADSLSIPFELSGQYGPAAIYIRHAPRDVLLLEWAIALMSHVEIKRHMRIACRSRNAVRAVMTLLEILGVSPDLLAVEITPVQAGIRQTLDEQRQSEAIKKFLIEEQHVPESNIQIKRPRKSDESRNLVNLSIRDNLHIERTTSHGLRYALQLVACYLMATGKYWPEKPERD
jgi:hypothetical protein